MTHLSPTALEAAAKAVFEQSIYHGCGYAPEVKPWKRIAIGRFVGFWQIGVPNGHSCGGADDQFTHFMPLPAPPMGK